MTTEYHSATIRTAVGTGEAGYAGDGGPAVRAALREPFMCDFDAAGNLFFCEARNHIVRRVDAATGIVVTVAGTGGSGLRRRRRPGCQRHPQRTLLPGGR